MIYLTADHHFGHGNIIDYCDRPFTDAEEMDRAMIEAWNSLVRPDDTVYHLGDFTLRGINKFTSVVERLNGHTMIVPGGHDWRWIEQAHQENQLTKPLFHSGQQHMHNYDVVIHNSLTAMKPPGYKMPDGEHNLFIVLCHYAMRVWDRWHYGSLHAYGHSHSNLPFQPCSLDVGVDNAKKLLGSYRPFSLDEFIKFATSKSIK